jgi:Immunity protein Imm1
MRLRVTVHENEPPIVVTCVAHLNDIIEGAAGEARAKGILTILLVETENKNSIGFVVGGNETVLGFTYGHQNPPYYSSRGSATGDEPLLTCYACFEHHTEFPRTSVIPLEHGMQALHEFAVSGELPNCIEWMEV